MADVIDYNTDLEHLLKVHAEECESFSILHRYSYEKYNERSNYINIPVIILSSAIGFATGIDIGYDNMNIILGVSSIFVGIIKSIDTYFQLGKRSESHRLCSLQFQQINKKIMIELSLKRDQRVSAKDMLQIIKTDIKNLQDIAPLIDDGIITMFKKNYGEEDPTTKKIKFNAHTPNLCNGLTQVTVNGDKPSRKGRGRGSRERRSRGSSRGSRGSSSYDSDDDSSGGDSVNGRGDRGSKRSGGGGGGSGNKNAKHEDGNASSASSSSGFMSSVSNMIQRGVNYIKGNTPSPTPQVSSSSSDKNGGHRHRSSRHHLSGHNDKHNKVIEIMGLVGGEHNTMTMANKEIGELMSIPIAAINSASNSAAVSLTNSVKNTPQLGAMNQPLANNLHTDFTVVNISEIQESAIQLQQLQQLQQTYQGQNLHRSHESQQSQPSVNSHHSYRPAIPAAVYQATLAPASRPVSRAPSTSHTPLRTTPSINNQLSVQNISPRIIIDNGLTLSADVIYNNNNNNNNADTNIATEIMNLVLMPENSEQDTDNMHINIVDTDEHAAAAEAPILPVLHFDIDDPEGMM
jgi:hypothetical protein